MLQPSRFAGLALGLTGVVIFGGTFPATRIAVMSIDPWFATVSRAAIAGILSAVMLILFRRPLPRAYVREFAALTVCIVFGFAGLSSLALTTVPSAHGGIILALLPLATAAAAVIFAGERPSPVFWVFAVLGSAVVLAYALHESGLRIVPGDILLLASVVVGAIGYAISGRLSRVMPGWEVISWALVFGLPFALVATAWLWPHDLSHVPLGAWIGLAYIGVMSQYVGFWAWNAALAIGGVARVSQVQLLQPFVTFVLAALVLGEAISTEMIVFALLVAAIVAFGRRAAIAGPAVPAAAP